MNYRSVSLPHMWEEERPVTRLERLVCRASSVTFLASVGVKPTMTESPRTLTPSAAAVLSTTCWMTSNFVLQKCPMTLSRCPSARCRWCSWLSLSSLNMSTLQATSSPCWCGKAMADTPGRPPDLSLMLARTARPSRVLAVSRLRLKFDM